MDRPILFSAPMIRAIHAGTKSQTRRIVKPRSKPSIFDGTWSDSYVLDPGNAEWRQLDLRFGIGDRLWVRESWKPHSIYARWKPREIPQSEVFFQADSKYAPSNTPWVPSIHMPRWVSRTTLIVTDVRVERLQDISEADAIAEGIERLPPAGPPLHTIERFKVYGKGAEQLACPYGARISYSSLWDAINGEGAWKANPWVVAVYFETHHCNIDAMDKREAV